MTLSFAPPFAPPFAPVLGRTVAELADLGLSAAEMRRLAAMTPDRLRWRDLMAQGQGLDPARLAADPALDVATALSCADCGTDGAAGPCPNERTFQALAAELLRA